MKPVRIVFFVITFMALGLVWHYMSNRKVGVTVETIQPAVKTLNWDSDLNQLIADARGIEAQFPGQTILTQDVVRECERMKTLFLEFLKPPVPGSIDIILQVHRLSSGEAPPPGVDPARSQELMSGILVTNKYDLVTVEGSGFDGYSNISASMDILARLKYEPTSPLYTAMVQQGIDPTSYFRALPFVTRMIDGMVAGGGDSGLKAWRELEAKTSTRFLAGESVPLSAYVGRLIMREINTPQRDILIEHVQTVRNDYVMAQTIKDMRERNAQRGAMIFGFMHEEGLKNLVSSLGINGKVYNATGLRK
jgi:hypothetical protein